MVLQINIKPQQVPSSVTHDKLKSLRYVDVGKSSFLSVHVTRKWEELDFMSTNDSREMTIFERVVSTLLRNYSRLLPKFRPANSEKRGSFGGTPHSLRRMLILYLFYADYSP